MITDECSKKARVIAYYLPQFHPVAENDLWWGKGFTEWTNVGKAKPLFRGHYQPRVPADLGYYDLRIPEIRQAQAEMAKNAGIEGFCYWHYWFGNGRRLLERPFHEVLNSGTPNFPFCLAWANHSWSDKTFDKDGIDKLLVEQLYPGEEDYVNHFYALLPAFKDSRYIRVNDKPLFTIFAPKAIPKVDQYLSLWRKLALENGLNGIHFVGITDDIDDVVKLPHMGFDAVNLNRLFHFSKHEYSLIKKVISKISRLYFNRSTTIEYKIAAKYFSGVEDKLNCCYPTLIPNWDHSPRSGRKIHILRNSTPRYFEKHADIVFDMIKEKTFDEKIVYIKSWNEWAEGNYMEPDLRFGKGYLDALNRSLNK